jgi:hypothetical protein
MPRTAKHLKVGVLLLGFPHKRSLLFKMLSRPILLRSINRLRAQFARPPLVID